MRRVAALVSIIGFAAGLSFVLRPPAGDAAVHAGRLTIRVPHGFAVYPIHAGTCRPDTMVIGRVVTDFRLPAHACVERALHKWAAHGAPANAVVLALQIRGEGPVIYDLHLPLSLHQRWYRLDGGERTGTFRATKMDYTVTYWSGPKAPAKDHAAVLRALRSIRPAS